MEMHIKDVIVWHIKYQMALLLIKTLHAFYFWQPHLHSRQQHGDNTHTHTHKMKTRCCPLRSCRIIRLQKRQVITQKLPALLWPVNRSAGMGPWWRKCNSVEEIGFRLLNPEAKLSSRRCTSVWTLIGSCGSRIAQQRGGGQKQNNNKLSVALS